MECPDLMSAFERGEFINIIGNKKGFFFSENSKCNLKNMFFFTLDAKRENESVMYLVQFSKIWSSIESAEMYKNWPAEVIRFLESKLEWVPTSDDPASTNQSTSRSHQISCKQNVFTLLLYNFLEPYGIFLNCIDLCL